MRRQWPVPEREVRFDPGKGQHPAAIIVCAERAAGKRNRRIGQQQIARACGELVSGVPEDGTVADLLVEASAVVVMPASPDTNPDRNASGARLLVLVLVPTDGTLFGFRFRLMTCCQRKRSPFRPNKPTVTATAGR